MKKILPLLFLMISISTIYAKSDSIRIEKRPITDNLQINLLGNASLASIVYEKPIYFTDHFFLVLALGAGYNQDFLSMCFFYSCPPEHYITIPHYSSLNFILDRNSILTLEFGFGGSQLLAIKNRINNSYYFFPIAGIRFIIPTWERIFFRLQATLPISAGNDYEIMPAPLGFGMGVSF